jgi:hypothetical protein
MANYKIVATIQDLEDHGNGDGYRHEASSIDLSPTVTIDGYTTSNVQQALEKLSEIAFPPEIPDATTSVKGIIRLNGDLGDTALSPRVKKIQGYPVANTSPTDGQILTWDDSSGWWEAKNPNNTVPQATTSIFGSVRLSDGITTPGDIGGNAGNLSVIKLQDFSLNLGGALNPVYSEQFLKWTGTSWSNSYLPIADEGTYGTVRVNGDIAGTAGSLRVAGIQTYPVDCPCEPYDGDVLKWIAADGYWRPSTINSATSTSLGGIKIAGDLGGTADLPQVIGWRYKPLGTEFSNPQRYDIPIYNMGATFASKSPRFGFDLEPTEEKWTLINLQDVLADLEFTPAGDLSGNNSSQTVVGLYEIPIDPSASEPTVGDVLMYGPGTDPESNNWMPTQLDPSLFFQPSGDLSGDNFAQTVVGWRGKDLSTSFSSPSDGDIPIFSSDGFKWNLTSLYSILESLSQPSLSNPSIREYIQNGIRNKKYNYQYSAQSVNTVRGTLLTYEIKDNTSLFLSGKIIGRVVQINEPEIIIPSAIAMSGHEDSGVNLTPSAPDRLLGFDLDGYVSVGDTVVYDVQLTYQRNDSIQPLLTGEENPFSFAFSPGDSNNIIAVISDYPYGINASLYKPIMQLVDTNYIQVVTGFNSNVTINWTIDLEILENGIE